MIISHLIITVNSTSKKILKLLNIMIKTIVFIAICIAIACAEDLE